MSMQDWDTHVAPTLRRIQLEADIVSAHATNVQRDVTDLPARPAWVTKAEDSLGQAELALSRALANVRAAREFYRKVKTEAV